MTETTSKALSDLPIPLPHPPPPAKPRPKHFVKNQIPDSILNDAALNAAISLLPANCTFEIHKIIWRARFTNATRIALQFPEGLLIYSLVISDILTTFGGAAHVFFLGDVTYGAYCVEDLSARALDAHLLVHFGHNYLVSIDSTTVPVFYVFVEISINTRKLFEELNYNFAADKTSFIMARTIQFSNAIAEHRSRLAISDSEAIPPSPTSSSSQTLSSLPSSSSPPSSSSSPSSSAATVAAIAAHCSRLLGF